jgi:hypothetical protein
MAISQADYQLKTGESIDAYNTRIASLRAADSSSSDPVSSAPPVSAPQNQTAQVNAALGGNYFDTTSGEPVKPFTPAPTPNPAPAPNPASAGTPAPTLPTPTAPAVNASSMGTIQGQLDTQRQSLQDAYNKQIADIQAQKDAAQAKIDEFTKNQQGTLDNMQTLSTPFRATLEQQKQQELYVTQNFQENQKLTDELDQLLTEGNNLIKQQQGLPVPNSILTANVNKTIADVNARAGVIQAVMAARNSQISQAYTMIDRAVAATTADRTDQLNYYKTLYDFYQNQKDDQGKQLIQLTSDQKDYVTKQIGLLENDLTQTQKNADFIKQAMIDPDKAQAYAAAGVTLNDTPEQIAKKLSDYGYAKEIATASNDMAQKGYSALLPGQTAPAGAEIISTTDSRGNTKQYYKTSTSGLSLADLIGTPAGDTTTATNAGTGKSGDILSATGLSLPVFNYLTQGSAALSRMTSPDRIAIMTAASNWAKKNGIDVSTFQSQYKAYNDVLQKNVERANNTSVFAGEVSGSADALMNVIDQKDIGTNFFGIGKIKAVNLVSLAAGKEVNDPLTQKYAFQLQAMTNDLAGYFAASRGANIPENADIQDAANVIANGLNKGSVQAFKDSIQTNEQKVNKVVNDAVTRAQKQVWSLLGVGDQFQPNASSNVDLPSFENGGSGSMTSNGVDLSKFIQ